MGKDLVSAESWRRRVYPLIVVFICIAVTASISLTFISAVTHQMRCEIIEAFDSSYSAEPPESATGILVAIKIHSLKEKHNCK